MSTRGFAKRRDANEPLIVAVLEAMGASVQRLSDKGVPDLLVGHDGLTVLIEVKGAHGKLTRDQAVWHHDWTGSPVRVVVTPEDAVVALLGKPATSVGDAGIWTWCPAGCGGQRAGCYLEVSHQRGTYPRILGGKAT